MDLLVCIVSGPSLFSKPEHSITELQSHNLDWKGLLVVTWSNSLLRANKRQLFSDGDFTASLGSLLKHFTTLIVGLFFFFVHDPAGTLCVWLVLVVSFCVPVDLQGKSSSASYTFLLGSCRQQ